MQKGAEIGENCSLGQNVNIANNVKIGNNVRIQNNVSVYEGVELEDNVFCGPSCVFTNVKTPRAHYPVHGIYDKTFIKNGASLGANSTVVCGHTVGRSAMVAAGAVVTKNVKDYALVAGVPARQIAGCANVESDWEYWDCIIMRKKISGNGKRINGDLVLSNEFRVLK